MGDPIITSATINQSAIVATLAECLAAGLHEDMQAKGVNNYVAFTFRDGDDNAFMAIFTKLPTGKTPMELQVEERERAERAEAERDHLRDVLAQYLCINANCYGMEADEYLHSECHRLGITATPNDEGESHG